MILARYFAFRFLKMTALVFAIFFAIMLLIDVIDQLRRKGYCVVIWTPEELGDADANNLEDIVTERGNDYLSTVL